MNTERLMGIIESEGCFSCSVRKTTKNPQFVPMFSLTQKYAKEELYLLKEHLHSIGIESVVSYREQELYIASYPDIIKLRDFLLNQKFFFKKKQASFLVWSRLIDMVKLNRFKTPDQIQKIWDLREQINPSKKGRGKKQLKDYLT